MGQRQIDIGSQLKNQRLARNLTLDALSKLAGVSKAMLSQIEKNNVNPTVATIIKIADALNIAVGELIESSAQKNIIRMILGRDTHYTFRADENCTIRTLSPLNLEKSIEFYRISLKSGGMLKSEAHGMGTEEFLYVSKGKIKVESGNESAELEKEDSIYYRADVPHSVENVSKVLAEVYLIVKYQQER